MISFQKRPIIRTLPLLGGGCSSNGLELHPVELLFEVIELLFHSLINLLSFEMIIPLLSDLNVQVINLSRLLNSCRINLLFDYSVHVLEVSSVNS